MFTHYRTQGFVLKKIDRGEADRIFTIYTEDFGKLELLAKAERKIKSKLRGGLELFYLTEIEFIQGKAHKTLTDAVLINSFKNLKKDLKRLRIAFKISETLDNLVKGQEPDKEIWRLLLETFNKLNTRYKLQATSYKIYYFFLWNLLSVLGYQVELYHCAFCQKKISPENIYFSLKEGGLICGSCQKKVKKAKPIQVNTIKIIRILLKKDWPILEKLKLEIKDLKQLGEISNYYLAEVLREIE